MANPVNNNGVGAPPKIGGPAPFGAKTATIGPDVTEGQGRAAVGNINETFARNPNYAPPPAGNENAAPPAQPAEAFRGEGENRVRNPHGREGDTVEVAGDRANRGQQNAGNPDFERAGDRGEGNAGRGNRGDIGEPKNENARVRGPQGNGDFDGDFEGPRGRGPNGNNGKGNGHDNGNHGRNRGGDDGGFRQNGARSHQTLAYDLTLNSHASDARGNNRGNSVRVLEQVMRTQDLHISVNNSNWRSSGNLPAHTAALVRSIETHLATLISGGEQALRVSDVVREITVNFAEQIGRARSELMRGDASLAVRFSDLGTESRVHVAASMLPAHFPEDSRGALLNFSEKQVVQGFYLARGFVAGKESPAQSPLATLSREAFPAEIRMSQLRDVAMIVKSLIVDSAAARSTANLDLAVQKFVRMLVANNEIGVLLATIRLAAQPETAGAISRTLALTQIYDLINRLAEAGRDAALRESGTSAMRDHEDLSVLQKSLREDVSVLRQHLEFNPAFAFDRSASAFHDPRDARDAQRNFVEVYRDEIDEWLASGRHRLVKEFDFGRPVGVVVEKGGTDIFEVAAARFVLVRDGSVQGWHFMKAFLVR